MPLHKYTPAEIATTDEKSSISKHTNKLTISIAWRSILFWSIAGLSAVGYNLLALILVVCPLKLRHKILSSWATIFTSSAKYVCGVTYQIYGSENIIAGPAIIASNHQSAWETISFTTIFPRHVWILKRELLRIPFFGWAIATLMPIAINRSHGTLAVQHILNQSVKRIKNGFWILAFPEGTRVAPGDRKPFKIGVARMACHLNLPILPVAHNAGYCLPKASFWLFPGEITVIINQAIYPKPNETAEQLLTRLEEVISQDMALLHSK